MEKVTLHQVGEHLQQALRQAVNRGGKDHGWEFTIMGSSLQYTFLLHLFDNIQLAVKMYPHRSAAQEPSFRLEVYQSQGNGNRGTRLTCKEFTLGPTVFSDLEAFFSGLLEKYGL